MHHPATEDLHPTSFFADAAACTTADETTHIHFSAGFGKGKIRRTETNLHVLAIHFFYKKIKGLFQVGERNILIDIQSFHLVKKTMAPGADGLVAVNTA